MADARILERVRARNPLVLNITNFVVMNSTANVLIAAGASPVMAHAEEEVEEMCALASSLVINMGTLDARFVDAMLRAGRVARSRGIPVVFDPVGVGATRYRTQSARRIMEELRPTIVRGNASEIGMLSGASSEAPKGVDSTVEGEAVISPARSLSETYGSVVVISGAVDHLVQGDSYRRVHNGTPLFTKVTGMGCSATAYLGAVAAVEADPFTAALTATSAFAIAGELAAENLTLDQPGSFPPLFLDRLAQLSSDDFRSRSHIS